MIVVTIAKWRQKLVWLLAAVLVAAVLLGQLAGREPAGLVTQPAHYTSPTTIPQEQAATVPATGDSSRVDGLLEKLRNFYRGE